VVACCARYDSMEFLNRYNATVSLGTIARRDKLSLVFFQRANRQNLLDIGSASHRSNHGRPAS
jgi:hypothetical protein